MSLSSPSIEGQGNPLTTPANVVVIVPEVGGASGLGHLDRCIALGEQLTPARCGVAVPDNPDAARRVSNGGARPISVPGDAHSRAAWAVENGASAVILDGYGFSIGFQASIRKSVVLVVIDDLNNPCCCDLVVNATAARHLPAPSGAERYAACPDHVLIGRDFAETRSQPSNPDHSANVLVGVGSGGIPNLAVDLASALRSALPAEATITLVRGPDAAAHEAALEGIAIAHRPDSLATLMRQTALFVGAAGLSAVQAAFMGVPSVIIPAVANQEAQAKGLSDAGCALISRSVGEATAAASALLANATALREMRRCGYRYIDGRGKERASTAILDLMRDRA